MPNHFKAYVYEAFHEDNVAQIKLRINVPFTPLKPSEVRIKVASAGLNPVDWKLITYGAMFLPTSPTPENPFRIGLDVSGQVTEVGADVKRFKAGDLVYSRAEVACMGTMAEFIDLEESYVAKKPTSLDHDHASAVPHAALTSYQALVQYADLKAGQRVLILGASGGCGIMAVQIAKALGAYVIATTSFRNADFVKSIGADQVIDYTKSKWGDVIDQHSLDVIYDCGLEPNTWANEAQKVLKKDTGAHFVTLGHLAPETPLESTIGAKLTQMFSHSSAEQLETITEWIEQGKIKVHIDSTFTFDQFVAAVERIKTGRVRGKVVVKVQDL